MPLSATIRELDYFSDSQVYFDRLSELDGLVWLDSGPGSSKFDILCAEPVSRFESSDSHFLHEQISKLRSGLRLDSLVHLPFTGGLIGSISYRAQHKNYGLQARPNAQADNTWLLFDWALIQDHSKKKCYALFLPSCRGDDIKRRLAAIHSLPKQDSKLSERRFNVGPFKKDISRAEYGAAFQKIQNYILAGDTYQVNFAQRFSAAAEGDMRAAYAHVRRYLSGAYSAYLDLGSSQILSFSPEQFVKLNDGLAQSKPIKGTIRRGVSKSEDRQLAEALLHSEKNRAENLMIVDLIRNDFSKNCLPHSVQVTGLFELESYQNVHHLVSTVQGKLSQSVNPIHFLSECFPGGSITGAPKKRAMEIIEELEQHPREIYCGSIAYVSTNGNIDSSIAIRTLMAQKGYIHCWGGGGIVADSTEEEEYQESIQKVQVLMNALTEPGI